MYLSFRVANIKWHRIKVAFSPNKSVLILEFLTPYLKILDISRFLACFMQWGIASTCFSGQEAILNVQLRLNIDMKKGQNRRSCPYTGKCEPEKSRILTYFTQCVTSHRKKKKKKRKGKKDRLSVYTINCKFLCWVRFYKNYYHKIPEKLLILYCNNIWNKVILMVFTLFGKQNKW